MVPGVGHVHVTVTRRIGLTDSAGWNSFRGDNEIAWYESTAAAEAGFGEDNRGDTGLEYGSVSRSDVNHFLRSVHRSCLLIFWKL